MTNRTRNYTFSFASLKDLENFLLHNDWRTSELQLTKSTSNLLGKVSLSPNELCLLFHSFQPISQKALLSKLQESALLLDCIASNAQAPGKSKQQGLFSEAQILFSPQSTQASSLFTTEDVPSVLSPLPHFQKSQQQVPSFFCQGEEKVLQTEAGNAFKSQQQTQRLQKTNLFAFSPEEVLSEEELLAKSSEELTLFDKEVEREEETKAFLMQQKLQSHHLSLPFQKKLKSLILENQSLKVKLKKLQQVQRKYQVESRNFCLQATQISSLRCTINELQENFEMHKAVKWWIFQENEILKQTQKNFFKTFPLLNQKLSTVPTLTKLDLQSLKNPEKLLQITREISHCFCPKQEFELLKYYLPQDFQMLLQQAFQTKDQSLLFLLESLEPVKCWEVILGFEVHKFLSEKILLETKLQTQNRQVRQKKDYFLSFVMNSKTILLLPTFLLQNIENDFHRCCLFLDSEELKDLYQDQIKEMTLPERMDHLHQPRFFFLLPFLIKNPSCQNENSKSLYHLYFLEFQQSVSLKLGVLLQANSEQREISQCHLRSMYKHLLSNQPSHKPTCSHSKNLEISLIERFQKCIVEENLYAPFLHLRQFLTSHFQISQPFNEKDLLDFAFCLKIRVEYIRWETSENYSFSTQPS